MKTAHFMMTHDLKLNKTILENSYTKRKYRGLVILHNILNLHMYIKFTCKIIWKCSIEKWLIIPPLNILVEFFDFWEATYVAQ